jgi:hypothetical protein
MSKGVLLFAFNSPKFNYFDMAVHTAKRVNYFLDLPVTVVTDSQSKPNNVEYNFDQIIITDSDSSNKRDWGIWLNKGRYKAFELSPYHHTILLDTDYMVNSQKLLKTFTLPTDFCCHDTTEFLMNPNAVQEVLSVYSFKTLWATVITFKKSKRSEQIFNCLKMVQENFEHFALIHGFIANTFRNDYALTVALRTVNGQMALKSDIIPWNLTHIGKNTSVYADDTSYKNTKFNVVFDRWQRGKVKKEYITIKDFDFHVMNKENFLELIK